MLCINVEDSKNYYYDDRGKFGYVVGERGYKGDGGRCYNEKKDDERYCNEDEEGNYSDDGEGYFSEDSEYGKDYYIKDGKKYDNKGGEENCLRCVWFIELCFRKFFFVVVKFLFW